MAKNGESILKMDINEETIEMAEYFKGLRERFESGEVTREAADTLANIEGKRMKAVHINFVNQMWIKNMERQHATLALPADNGRIIENEAERSALEAH